MAIFDAQTDKQQSKAHINYKIDLTQKSKSSKTEKTVSSRISKNLLMPKIWNWQANKMKNVDREGGAPQGRNVVVMHVSQIKSVLQIYVSNLECKHTAITL